jgi:hypothetical protein
MNHNPGISATSELNLRVSLATLVRVVFKHPGNGEWMLALERKTTRRENKVEVKSQPIGEAIRILDLDAIRELIGDFQGYRKRGHFGWCHCRELRAGGRR